MQNTQLARIQRILEFGVACKELDAAGPKATRSQKRKLKAFQMSLRAMLSDELLGTIAKKHLEVLDALQHYIKTGSEVSRKRARNLWDEASRHIYEVKLQ
ncbi:hypothetical protein MKZ02_21040 [Pseudobacillus sp. FSL P4-0506]|uniref:hypothetical protein n=1 Tax=Pseudobacillus sp. FSL P4-0506 TaxID=2921576 RepID=UPI0030F65EE2